MAVALSVVGGLNWWYDGHIWLWLVGAAIVVVVIAVICQAALKPLNWAWFKFGLLLHALVNPIIMALIFYGTVLPTGLVMRLVGKDVLRLKRQPNAKSYWIKRQSERPAAQTMKDQF